MCINVGRLLICRGGNFLKSSSPSCYLCDNKDSESQKGNDNGQKRHDKEENGPKTKMKQAKEITII